MRNVSYSVLDFVPIIEGYGAKEAYLQSIALAQHVEQLGYGRYWISEHHNMPGIASAATPLVMSYIAGATKHIRIGAGGVMLPNHAPLIVAEQFGTLEAMYPRRIDLGLGRAPGTDRQTARALRRNRLTNGDDFPEQLAELRHYFKSPSSGQAVRAIPGEGQDIPIWLLGSSDFSARLAAKLGLPFAFASHFAPAHLLPALKIYREMFQPSEVLQKPYAMAAVNIFAADTHAEAEKIATSATLQFLSLIRNMPGKLPKPVDHLAGYVSEQEQAVVKSQYEYTFIGTGTAVKADLERFIEWTEVDEVMIVSSAYDLEARKRTYDIVAEVIGMKG
ncbi:MAG: LLM class flavin-dependent oxidoreductase [Defluviitaleaceae bacterium]|nr:LLM class flavin-dependent oxidoreductase [Defluviitaleaceae bacterium]